VKCRDCGIIFITSCGNAGRKDLRCPFGCQQARRQKESQKRSAAYYRTKEGRKKKKEQNDRRQNKEEIMTEEEKEIKEKLPAGVDEETLIYLKDLISATEGRKVSRAEIIAMLKTRMRQHSLDKDSAVGYSIKKAPS
jgi:hypothetical protein